MKPVKVDERTLMMVTFHLLVVHWSGQLINRVASGNQFSIVISFHYERRVPLLRLSEICRILIAKLP
jgi:hypothetical protein